MRRISAVVVMFLLSLAIFSDLTQAQDRNQKPGSKIIGEKGSLPVIGEKGAVASIADDGLISVIGEEGLALLVGEDAHFEVLGGGSIVSIIGEEGSQKIIGEKGSQEIIGEKGSQKIIGEEGRVVRDVKTGRTVQFNGSASTDTRTLNKLNVGNRLRVKAGSGTASPASSYQLVEPAMRNLCCTVVKVASDGIVLAGSAGDSFHFNVPDPKIRASLRAGQPVGTDRGRRWAFIRTSAVPGLKGQQATYSFPIRPDRSK